MDITAEQFKDAARKAHADGRIDVARSLIARAKAAESQQSTTMIEQIGNGVNEGIAATLGAPVDLMTMGLNAGIAGVNRLAGTKIPRISDPAGGSGTFQDGLKASGALTDAQPQTTAQHYGRSIARETGAMAIPGGVALRGAQKPAQTLAGLSASAVGAGTGAQAAGDLTGGNATAEGLGALAGGLTPAALTRQARPRVPSTDDLRGIEASAYGAVEQSTAKLSPKAAQLLADDIANSFGSRTTAARKMNPKAAVAADAIAEDLRAHPPTLAEVNEARRWIGQNVAGSADASERAIGVEMKRRIDAYLDNLQPTDVVGTNDAAGLVGELKAARQATTRRKKAEVIEAPDTGVLARGETRDAIGGSESGAILQRLRSILENPKQRRQFQEWELKAMRDVIKGTPTTRAVRLLSRMAPTSGQLPMGGFVGASAGAGLTGNPLLLAPSAIGEGAKRWSDAGTRRATQDLANAMRNGGPIAKGGQSDAGRRMIAAFLASQAGSEP